MCYRCGLCQAVVPPRQPRRVHVVTREAPQRSPFARTPYRTEIAREIPVCGSCQSALANGVPLARLARERPRRTATAPVNGSANGAAPAPTNDQSPVAHLVAEVVEPAELPQVEKHRPAAGAPLTLGGRVVRRKERS